MKTYTPKTKSRRETPWTGVDDATPVQAFIEGRTGEEYATRHPRPGERGELDLLNSIAPRLCPRCKGERLQKYGHTGIGIRRYRCSTCGSTFTILTGTIFDSRKLPVSEWLGFLLDLFSYSSLNLASKVNRNSLNTTRYWLRKVFLTLEGTQDGTVLKEKVWLDETFYKVRRSDVFIKEDGKEPRGTSRNQICIGIATDGRNMVCHVEGNGSPGKKRTQEVFQGHIERGATLVHDGDPAHSLLIKELSLVDEMHPTKETKGLPDDQNPLQKVNRCCQLLKAFLRSHSGMDRDDLQGYLDLFAFIMNPPSDKYRKLEKFLNLVFENPKMLRYRD